MKFIGKDLVTLSRRMSGTSLIIRTVGIITFCLILPSPFTLASDVIVGLDKDIAKSKYDTRAFGEDIARFEPNYLPSFSIGIEEVDTKKLDGIVKKLDLKPYTKTSYKLLNTKDEKNSKNGSLKTKNLTWHTYYVDSRAKISSDRKTEKLKNPWDEAHDLLAVISKEIEAKKIEAFVVVEPDFYIDDPYRSEKYIKILDKTVGEQIIIKNKQSRIIKNEESIWPGRGFTWHMDEDKSQLTAAQDRVNDSDIKDGKRIRIAHLDTGYSSKDPLNPEYMKEKDSRDFVNSLECNGPEAGEAPKEDWPSHGMRTLSVLSGNWTEIVLDSGKTVSGYLGGNPYAEVLEYRIGSSPIHLRPKEMTAAIVCAIQNEVDVISLSAGGFPSISQRQAINDAYANGVAIFAATGDFYQPPLSPISTPKTVVFPARYSRVMGVAGVTYDDKSYADAPCIWCLRAFCDLDWWLRGSFGPEVIMKGHVISAYSPNITNSFYRHPNSYGIGLNGAGTSNSTPQVAAAASLWLQRERVEFERKEETEKKEIWRSWKKAQAVYDAIIKGANKKFDGYSRLKFGEGILKANNTMNVSLDDVYSELKKKDYSSIGYRWIYDLISSIFWIGLSESEKVSKPKVAKLDMLTTEALQLVYNTERFNEIIQRLEACEEDSGSVRHSVRQCLNLNPRLAKSILEEILASDKISNELKKQLNNR